MIRQRPTTCASTRTGKVHQPVARLIPTGPSPSARRAEAADGQGVPPPPAPRQARRRQHDHDRPDVAGRVPVIRPRLARHARGRRSCARRLRRVVQNRFVPARSVGPGEVPIDEPGRPQPPPRQRQEGPRRQRRVGQEPPPRRPRPLPKPPEPGDGDDQGGIDARVVDPIEDRECHPRPEPGALGRPSVEPGDVVEQPRQCRIAHQHVIAGHGLDEDRAIDPVDQPRGDRRPGVAQPEPGESRAPSVAIRRHPSAAIRIPREVPSARTGNVASPTTPHWGLAASGNPPRHQGSHQGNCPHSRIVRRTDSYF